MLVVIPRGESGQRRRPSHTLLFDVARGLAHRVPLTKLVELDGDVWPYLAMLMVATLVRAHEMLTIPDTLQQGYSTGRSHSLPPVWLRTFPSWEFCVREFSGNSRDSGISRLAGITEIPVPWKIPFLSAHISDFQSVFCIGKIVL